MKLIFRILISIAVAVAAVFLFVPYTANIKTIDSKVTVITDRMSSMYLVKTNDGYFAIDTGGSREAVRRGLQKAGIDPQDVKNVLLTHSDYDHVQGLPLFEEAEIYLPKAEEKMLEGTERRFKYIPFLKNTLHERLYATLAGNEEIVLDDVTVKTISLPGHTVGSVGYLVDGKYLFVGDALNLKDGKAKPFFRFLTMDMDQMKDSIRKIADLQGVQYLFTAHSGYSSDYSEAMKDWH